MNKLKITKPGIRLGKKISVKPDYATRYSNCEFEVPGVGRLRTGEKHPDFHLDEIQNEVQSTGAILTVTPEKVNAK